MTTINNFISTLIINLKQFIHSPAAVFSKIRLSSWLVVIALLISAVFLLWNTISRHQDFNQQEFKTAKISVEGTKREIVSLIKGYRRTVKLLADRENELLTKLSLTPENNHLYELLVEKTKIIFPESFAVTLANSQGVPIVEPVSGFIGSTCKIDLKNFSSQNHPPELFIHPNPLSPHFDIMTKVNLGLKNESIFFVSFKVDVISNLLSSSQQYQHNLILLNQSKPGFVEVSSEDTLRAADGSLQNADGTLQDALKLVAFSSPVKGTLWDLASIPNQDYAFGTIFKMWFDVLLQFLVLCLFSGVIIKYIQRTENKFIIQNIKLSSQATELKKSKTRLVKAQQIARMGSWDYNLITSKLHLSDGAYEIFGFSSQESSQDASQKNVTLLQIFNKISPDDREHIRHVISSSIVKRKYSNTEFHLSREDNAKCILFGSVEITVDENNRPIQLLGIVQDITQQKQAEESNKKALIAKMNAESASIAKSDFLANMSHEIRTPLTAIIGFAEALLHSDQPMRERTNAIKTIIRNGDHLLQVINDILDLSKIEAEKLEFDRINFCYFHILNDVESLIRMQLLNKNIEFNINYNFPLPKYIKSDPLRLKQILINVCSNAIKFTHSGFVHINIECDSENESINFEVCDSGIGMQQHEIDKIFDLFTQADLSTTKEYGGSGLGLTISKYMAGKLGGDIQVYSQPDVGSKFTISVNTGNLSDTPVVSKIKQVPTEQLLPAVSRQTNSLSGKILLAEDNEDNQRLLKLYLEKMGAELTIANNGKIAIELAQNSEFNLILMDMQMPVMDGLEAVKTLRKHGYKKPIVALTANAMNKDRVKCMAAGCDDFISKPIRQNDLYRTVSHYLLSASPDKKSFPPMTSTLIEEEPELMDLVFRFVNNLPGTLEKILLASKNKNWKELKNVCHQLKGVGGGYGYPKLTEISAKILFQLESNCYDEAIILVSEMESMCQQIYAGLNPRMEVNDNKSSVA